MMCPFVLLLPIVSVSVADADKGSEVDAKPRLPDSGDLKQASVGVGKPALPGKPCLVEPLSDWEEQEKWVWEQVCEGKTANFNEDQNYKKKFNEPEDYEPDPKKPEDWQKRENRVLRSEFLETILLHEPYRGALTRHGVRIVGAWFKEKLDMENAKLTHELWLDASRFEKGGNLNSLHTTELISLEGSKFSDTLGMARLQVDSSLLMSGGAEFADVDLISAKVGGILSMIGSKFSGTLDMNALQVEEDLFMRGGAEFAGVDLTGAKVGATLDMAGSKFIGTLNMDKLEVDSSLFMRGGAEFADVVLRGAKVGGQLNMEGSKFIGTLNMDSLQVDSSLFMRGGAEFADVVLSGTKVGGQLDMDDSKFSGTLNMDSLQIGETLFARNVEIAPLTKRFSIDSQFQGQLDDHKKVSPDLIQVFQNQDSNGISLSPEATISIQQEGSVWQITDGNQTYTVKKEPNQLSIYVPAEWNLIFAKIEENLDLSGSTLPSLDLTGTQILGELRLGSEIHSSTQWHPQAKLTLRNTQVGALQDVPDAWPDTLVLDGFTYGQLGGLAAGGESMADQDVSWMKAWLEKQEGYSPQPYEQLAGVLRKMGHRDKAKDVLYADSRRHAETQNMSSRFGLFWSNVFIGHGYRIHRVSYWAFGLVVLGAIVLYASGEAGKDSLHNMPYGIAYSLDLLLPVIKLREYHYDKIDLQSWARYYFYFHQLMGYVIAAFLAAGLSKLVK